MSLSDEIEYTEEVGHILKVEFGLLSPERILKQSVCEVYNHITNPDNVVGTLFDTRMGSSSRNKVNSSSGLSMMYDPGNFGHINLAKPVVQYHFLSEIVSTLNSVCHRCSSILIEKTENNLQLLKTKAKKNRFAIIDKLKDKGCPNCGACVVKFLKDRDGLGRIIMKKTLSLQANVKNCQKAAENEGESEQSKSVKQSEEKEESSQLKSFVDPEVALNILKNISDEDVELLGFNKDLSRPDWMIWTVMPVPPPSMRPAVKNDSGKIQDDDLTYKLNDIIKTNNQIRNLLQESENKPDKGKYINHWWQLLQYHVTTYIDNNISGIPESIHRSGRPYKTIRQRIKAKEGRIRGNLMGKRVDGSARTVITPDPNISIDELGVPIEILTNLTFPEVATPYNITYLTTLIRNGQTWPGAKCIKYNNVSQVEQKNGRCSQKKRYRCVLKYLSQEQRDQIVIRPGDIVYRHLMEGDWVLFNRQPSLHKMSMMGHRIKARNAKSFGLHPNVTQPYGADFDGDEMNLHVVRSLQTQYEVNKLCAVPTQIVSPQASRPVIGLVQDSLLGIYLITNQTRLDYNPLNLMDLMQISGWLTTYDGKLLPSTGEINNNQVWDGASLVSSYFPKISYKFEDDDNNLQIQDGQMLPGGYFTKSSFGAKAGSVIHLTWNDYGPEFTRNLIDNTTSVAMQYLLVDGFSVGLKDVYITQQDHKEIVEKVNHKVIEAKLKIDFLHRGWYPILGEDLQKSFNNLLKLALGVTELPYDPERFLDTGKPVAEQFEIDIYTVLDRARAIAEKETYKKLSIISQEEKRSNRMASMVDSGSKGNKTNLVQIVSLLGQQGIGGGRAPENLYRRTLPYFCKDDITPEARGFIDRSYLEGLTPIQYIPHAQAGRIGVISTSIKTAETGYLQRKLMKMTEDAHVKYDGTVRNSNNVIIQYAYGQDGFDGSHIEPQKLDYLDKSNTDFQFIYAYLPDKDLSQLMTENAYRETVQNPNWKEILESEFNQISLDRQKLKKIYGANIPEKIYSPVNFRRMIKNYQYRFKLHQRETSDISPIYIIEKVNLLIGELVSRVNVLHGEDDFLVLFALIRSHLASKKLLKHKYDQNSFNFLLEEVRRQYYKSEITPGEMVGAIAAQSIGEPTTQLTLDVFHSTGIGSGANVSRGVPRLKEILRVAQNLATPSLEVHLDQDYLKSGLNLDNLDESKQQAYSRAEEIASRIEYTVLKDLVDNVQILFDKNDCASKIIEDQPFINAYYELTPKEECLPMNSNSPWLLRIKFREDMIYKKGIKMLDIATAFNDIKSKKIKDIIDLSCIFSDDNAESLVCRVRINNDLMLNQNPVNVMRLVERLILNLKIVGIDGIETARVSLIEPFKISMPDGTIGQSFDYVVHTSGVNLFEIFNEPYIDYTKTLSNHIIEIYEVLGIEAAREIIIKEITDVLTFAGSYVNPRHIELLADTMTREGYLVSVDRHGINKGDSSTLAKASFEETTAQLFSSAMYGETDPITGVSANIMFGQPFKGGTNSYKIGLDEALLATTKIPIQEFLQDRMGDPEKVTEETGYCDLDVEDHFTFQL